MRHEFFWVLLLCVAVTLALDEAEYRNIWGKAVSSVDRGRGEYRAPEEGRFVVEFESSEEEQVLMPFFAQHKDAFSEEDRKSVGALCGQPGAVAKRMLEKLKETAGGDLSRVCEAKASLGGGRCLASAREECDSAMESKKGRPFLVDCPPDRERLLEKCEDRCEEEWEMRCGGSSYGLEVRGRRVEGVLEIEEVAEEVTGGVVRVYGSPSHKQLQQYKMGGITGRVTEEASAGLVRCTAEAKGCPDGSTVGRVGADCEFAPCPEGVIRPRPVPPISSYCGDGICQNAACLGLDCPPAESSENCPADCKSISSSNCVDSDGGKNYAVKGVVKYNLNYEKAVQFGVSDSCSGNQLYEAYCTPEGWASNEYYTCEGTCRDGACQKAVSTCGNRVCEPGEADFCPACAVKELCDCRGGSCPQDCAVTKPIAVCGNGICEEGEASYCPPCVNSDPPCMAPCSAGSCPGDCQVRSCPVDAPMPPCKGNLVKRTDEQGCLHYSCEKMACPLYAMPRCVSNEHVVSAGYDEQGCPLPPKCISGGGCPPPAMPDCFEGMKLAKELDVRGCPRYFCVPVEGYCDDEEGFFRNCRRRSSEECKESAEREYERLKKYCEKDNDWREECWERAEEGCARKISKERCLELVSEDRLYKMFLKKAEMFCRFEGEGRMEKKLEYMARPEIAGEHAEVLQEKSKEWVQVNEEVREIEQAEEGKGFAYKFKSLFGLMKDQELSEAQRIRENLRKLEETIQVLRQVSEGLSDPLAQAALADQMTSLREQQAQLEKLAEEKEKRAKGLFGLFG